MNENPVRPHRQAITAAQLVTLLYQRIPEAQEAFRRFARQLDGFPGGSDSAIRSATPASTVERAVMARDRLGHHLTEVNRWCKVINATAEDVWSDTHRYATRSQVPMTTSEPHPLENIAWTIPRISVTPPEYDDLMAGIRLIATAAHNGLRECDQLATPDRRPGVECSGGRGREGAYIPYTPHSRDPENGWADPTCRDLVNSHAPICDACYLRESRWRRRNHLQVKGIQLAS